MANTIQAIGGIPTNIVTIGLLIIEAVTKSPANKPKIDPIAKDIPKPKKALFIVIKTFSIVESSVKI